MFKNNDRERNIFRSEGSRRSSPSTFRLGSARMREGGRGMANRPVFRRHRGQRWLVPVLLIIVVLGWLYPEWWQGAPRETPAPVGETPSAPPPSLKGEFPAKAASAAKEAKTPPSREVVPAQAPPVAGKDSPPIKEVLLAKESVSLKEGSPAREGSPGKPNLPPGTHAGPRAEDYSVPVAAPGQSPAPEAPVTSATTPPATNLAAPSVAMNSPISPPAAETVVEARPPAGLKAAAVENRNEAPGKVRRGRCQLDDGEGGVFPRMERVPAGSYTLKEGKEAPSATSRLKARGLVKTRVEKPFFVQREEVSHAQFGRFLAWVGGLRGADKERVAARLGMSVPTDGGKGRQAGSGEVGAVKRLSQEGTMEYVDWLRKQSGCDFRLQSREEWTGALLYLQNRVYEGAGRESQRLLENLLSGEREWTRSTCSAGFLLVGGLDDLEPGERFEPPCMLAMIAMGEFRVVLHDDAAGALGDN
ncbi:MAG: SUMF1/EgtB/PvdO family nonheme iron enzyme [Magnetococcales bacterium]|nr:SUMF1/EgtB/PvdO family nonheme iron enzyme [Magnetococcales bacterium]